VPRLPARILTGLRDAWVILGVTLALFLVLEWSYRGQAELRRTLRGAREPTGTLEASGAGTPGAPAHPYAGETWWEPWRAARSTVLGTRWDAYRGWWGTPGAAPGLTVDSSGRRHTVTPDSAGPVRARVAMLGGSTMWGYTARDAHTIPALLAQELVARGVHGVEVVNHAQAAYVLAQGVATLTELVREGRIPDVVVFLEGNNEAGTAWRIGRVGGVFAEPYLVERFEHRHGILADLARWGEASELVQRVGTAVGLRTPPELVPPPVEAVCPESAARYARQAEVIAALGERFDFEPLLLWQPLLANSAKPRSPWEVEGVGSREGWVQTQVACRADAVEAMKAVPDVRFEDLSALFDTHAETIFLDHAGHVTEAANAVIAARIAELIEATLRARIAS
jgi:hypothetical protein